MKKLLAAFVGFVRADFRPGLYAFTAGWLGLWLLVNYHFDLEDTYIDAYRGRWQRWVLFFGLYGAGYFPVAYAWLLAHGRLQVWRQAGFWAFSVFGLAVIATWVDFTGYEKLAEWPIFSHVYGWAFQCLANLSSALTVWLPLAVVYFFYDKRPTGFYGFRRVSHLRAYGLLFLAMLPLVGWAAFQPDFQATYPMYKNYGEAAALGVPGWVTALGYEACYGFDFVSTELLIRGFMVIGLSQWLGRGAVLPMVVVYAMIHFGKPLGETIGSIAGGYILGVLAHETRSIWGGIIVHLGVAWLMEAAAYLHKT